VHLSTHHGPQVTTAPQRVPADVDSMMRVLVPALFKDPKIAGAKGIPYVPWSQLPAATQRKLSEAISKQEVIFSSPPYLRCLFRWQRTNSSRQGLDAYCLIHPNFARKRLATYQRHRCRLQDPLRSSAREKHKGLVAARRKALKLARAAAAAQSQSTEEHSEVRECRVLLCTSTSGLTHTSFCRTRKFAMARPRPRRALVQQPRRGCQATQPPRARRHQPRRHVRRADDADALDARQWQQ
jgi:hypothetical protein